MAGFKLMTFERGQMKVKLTRFKNTLEQFTPGGDTIRIAIRLEKIEALFDRFEVIQKLKLEAAVDSTDQASVQEEERMRFEDTYYDIVTRARTIIELDKEKKVKAQEKARLASTVTTHVPTSIPNISSHTNALLNTKLPVIKLKEFDGSYDKWIKFRDTFKSMIHDNPDISKITKFHYLDSALQKDARRAIESLGVSEANYDSA